MFERYTEKARRAIFFARYEASELGSEAIEAEHILLGVLREDKVLAQTLFADGTSDINTIRDKIATRPVAGKKVPASVDMPLSATSKRVLARAADESEKLAQRHIATEHLLLGLIREKGSLASELLLAGGVTANEVIRYARDQYADYQRHAPDLNHSPETAHAPLSAQLKALVDRLSRKGVFGGEQFNEQLLTSFGDRHVHAGFNLLLDLLVSKGVISEDEKVKISSGQS
jgi:ATP-dependent Clp protease ATP-binding subunit ClpC